MAEYDRDLYDVYCSVIRVLGVTQLYGRLFGHHSVLQSELNQLRQLDGAIDYTEQSIKVCIFTLNVFSCAVTCIC